MPCPEPPITTAAVASFPAQGSRRGGPVGCTFGREPSAGGKAKAKPGDRAEEEQPQHRQHEPCNGHLGASGAKLSPACRSPERVLLGRGSTNDTLPSLTTRSLRRAATERRARPRWERSCFSAGLISANVRPSPSAGANTGS